ncbi:MAG: hypothetical protein U0984_19635 [Prosthecobacter sp.]|nr:hypothetical protein [Prosthecobacter sp.]
MNCSSWSRPLLALGALITLVGCSEVKPAGSLGYMVDGDPRFRPVPKNYRHVPPKTEEVAPQFKLSF